MTVCILHFIGLKNDAIFDNMYIFKKVLLVLVCDAALITALLCPYFPIYSLEKNTKGYSYFLLFCGAGV